MSRPVWTHKLRKFKDKRGDWRWHIKVSNCLVVAESGEGYKRKKDMNTALWNLVSALRDETCRGLP